MLITRKCNICKQSIEIERDNLVYDKEKYFHYDCFINSHLRKKRNKLQKEEIIIKAKNLQKENFYIVKDIIDKAKLYYWIQHTYNVVVLPSYFFIKMDSIYDGSFKGLSKGIPAEDILDMWQRKKNELDRIADGNKKKDKVIDGLGRINYDLAVILSKYDSYLRWKEKQKIKQVIESERQVHKDLHTIDYKQIYDKEQSEKEFFNISDIIDDI